MTTQVFTPQQTQDLDVARAMAAAGVPVFVAHPNNSTLGFRLPDSWQTTAPNPRYVDAWRPGMALCAVMGHGLDLVDVDPRNGYQKGSLDGLMPTQYAVAGTPSDGVHYFVASLGVRSRDSVLPGVDVKAGVDGEGHGFAFISPTERRSKITGELRPYRWSYAPTLEQLKATADDRTGEKLAELVRLAHGSGNRNGQEERDHFKPSPWDDLAATIAANTRHDAMHKLASALRGRGGWRAGDALAYMREVVWPKLDQTRGGHPYTEVELEADVRDVFTRYDDGHETTAPTVLNETAPTATTLDECHAVFQRWLGDQYDLDVLDVVLCALAAERLDGDPLWLLVISGPGAAKTETVQACAGAGAFVTSTISSDAALLSGSPNRDKAKDATGGLLRRIGDAGVLVVKDVTSVISMNRDLRTTVLAAMREVYDGFWERNLGVDGGRSIPWRGRIAVIGAVTTAWDTAHAVVATMGDRFVLVRLDSSNGRHAAFRHTMANTGDETTMRAELAAAVRGVIAGMNAQADLSLRDAETERLLPAADLVTLSRTGVEFDYKGDVIDAHAPEMPTRFARQLQQIIRGGLALGMDRTKALKLAIRCARDSMPPVRLAIVDDLAKHPHSTPREIRRRINAPRATVNRQCQALHILRVLDCDEVEYGDQGYSHWYYSLAEGIDPAALKSGPDLSVTTPNPLQEGYRASSAPGRGTDISGPPAPQVSALDDALGCDCGHPLDQHAGPGCDVPVIHIPADPWSST